MTKSQRLAQIVAQHETYWASIAQRQPTPQIRQWLAAEWDPFFTRWMQITADGDPLSPALVHQVSQSLSQIREHAIAQGISVPDIGSATRQVSQPQPQPQPIDPYATRDIGAEIAADINRRTNERFWQQTGYKPGERLDPRDPQDARMIPVWVKTRYEVALETGRQADPNQPLVATAGLTEAVSTPREIATRAVWDQMDRDSERLGEPFGYYSFIAYDNGDHGVRGYSSADELRRAIDPLEMKIGPEAYIASFRLDASAPRLIGEWISQNPRGSHADTKVSGGNCGARTFGNVTAQAIERIFTRLREKGADVVGSNPWRVFTHDHGVELSGAWDAQSNTLKLEVTDSDFIAPCSAVWSALDDMLAEVGAVVASTTIVGSRGGGGRGFHHGGGGRGRRFFGGPGGLSGWWNTDYYPDAIVPVYDEGDGSDDGDDLIDVAPVISAGARGCNVQLSFSPATKNLDAVICIDGRRYRARADLSDVLDGISGEIARYHDQLHGDPHAPAAVSSVQGEVNEAIRVAGEALVGAALDQHQREICAGWFDGITSAVSSAINSVGHAAKSTAGTVGHTLVSLKGPIAAAAGMAAGAAALSIPGVGPLVAPMAGKLANDLVNAAAGSGSVQQAAQNALTQAKAVALRDPRVAKALDLAHQAVAKSTIAHHVAQTVANAASGNPNAQRQIAELAQAAQQGDAAAMDLTSLASDITDAVTDNAGNPEVSGWFAPFMLGAAGAGAAAYFGPRAWDKYVHGDHAPAKVSGHSSNDAKHALSEIAARTAAAEHAKGARIVGVAVGSPGSPLAQSVRTFRSIDDADDWFAAIAGQPSAYGYVAYYDAADPMWPDPVNDAHGHATGAASVKVAGFLPYLLAGGAGAAAGAYFWPAMKAKIDSMFTKKAAV